MGLKTAWGGSCEMMVGISDYASHLDENHYYHNSTVRERLEQLAA